MSENDAGSSSLRSRVAWWIQTGANAAVFAAAMAVLWLAFHRNVEAPGPLPPIYAAGEKIGSVGRVDFRNTPATLVMYLRQDCTYCRQSLPFYHRLTAAAKRAGAPPLRFVVATTDEESVMRKHLNDQDLSVDDVASVKQGALKIPGTPALLLVDATGTITKVWRGLLSGKEEEAVFAQLGLQILPDPF